MDNRQNPNIKENPKQFSKQPSYYNARLPKSLPPVFNPDEPKINELYTSFLSENYDNIMKLVNSGQILNFRNKDGKTLIHAVISNESPDLSEDQKIKIIKELVNQNVSINAMDSLNRNPLHYAATKGYSRIINELINLNCDKTLIDNDGNAPVHLFAEKFIDECKKNELFDENNRLKNISNNDDLINAKNAILTQMINYVSDNINSTNKKSIKQIVEQNKYFNSVDINKIFKENSIESSKIFLNYIKNLDKPQPSVEDELISNLDKTMNDIRKFYENMSFDKNNTKEIIEEDIIKKRELNFKNIISKFEDIQNTINQIWEQIDIFEKNYYEPLLKFFYTSYYYFNLLMSSERETNTGLVLNFVDDRYGYIKDPANNFPKIFEIGYFIKNTNLTADNTVLFYNDNPEKKDFNYKGTSIETMEFNGNVFGPPPNLGIPVPPYIQPPTKFLVYNKDYNKVNITKANQILSIINSMIDDNSGNKIFSLNEFDLLDASDLDTDINFIRTNFYDENNCFPGMNRLGADKEPSNNGIPIVKDINQYADPDGSGNNVDLEYLFLINKFDKEPFDNDGQNRVFNETNYNELYNNINNNDSKIKINEKFILTDIKNLQKRNDQLKLRGNIKIKTDANLKKIVDAAREVHTYSDPAYKPVEIAPGTNLYRAIYDYSYEKDPGDDATLLDHYHARIIAYKKALEEFVDEQRKNAADAAGLTLVPPVNDACLKNARKAYIAMKIIQSKLPGGYENTYVYKKYKIKINQLTNFENQDYTNKEFKFAFIRSGCEVIKNYLKCIEQLIYYFLTGDNSSKSRKMSDLLVSIQDNMNETSIKYNTIIIGLINEMVNACMINLNLIYQRFMFVDLKNVLANYIELNEIHTGLISTEKDIGRFDNISDYSQILLNECLTPVIDDLNKVMNDKKLGQNLSKLKYNEDISNIFENFKKIIRSSSEISEEFNNTQSIGYLDSYLNKKVITDGIKSFYTNKFNYNFDIILKLKIKELTDLKIVKISKDPTKTNIYTHNIDKKLLISTLYIFGFDHNTNTLYTNYNDIDYAYYLFKIENKNNSFEQIYLVKKRKPNKPIKYDVKRFLLRFEMYKKKLSPNPNTFTVPVPDTNVYTKGYLISIKPNSTYPLGTDIKKNDKVELIYIDPKLSTSSPFVLYFKYYQDNFKKQYIPTISLYNSSNLFWTEFDNILESIKTLIDIKKNKTNFMDNFKDLNSEIKKYLEIICDNEELFDEFIKESVYDYIILYINDLIGSEINGLIKKYFSWSIKDSYKIGSLKNLEKILQIPIEIGKNKNISNIKNKFIQILNENNDLIEDIVLNSSGSGILTEKVFGNKVTGKLNTIRVFDNKCININQFNQDTLIKLNPRIEDLNGNTILNRFVNQYNKNGIKYLLSKDPGLLTFKNSKQEDSIQYVLRLIKTIQDDYLGNMEDRLNKYSQVLENRINSDEEFKDINIDQEQKTVYNIVLNSIYMFNEFIWTQMLNFPGNWTVTDELSLANKLGIQTDDLKNENLLIKKFDSDDQNTLIKKSKELIGEQIFETQKRILENEKEQLEKTKANIMYTKASEYNKNFTKSASPSTTSTIAKIDTEITEKQNKIDKLVADKNKLSTTVNIKINIVDLISKSQLITDNNTIDYNEYIKLATELQSYYFKIIKILNEKISKTNCINKSQLILLGIDISKFRNNLQGLTVLEPIPKYYTNVIDKLYGEFKDLDRYEDSNYNVVFKAMYNIIVINTITVISSEMFNMISKYMQSNFNPNKKVINEEGLKSLDELIKKYLIESFNNELNFKNPDKIYPEPETLTNRLLVKIFQLYGIDIETINSNQEQVNELKKFMDFYKIISNNIAKNTYEELIYLLSNLKKMSLLIDIFVCLTEASV